VVPVAPLVQSPAKMLGLVCLAALALPFVLAIGWERRVRRIVDPRQIEEGAQLPVLAEIAALPRRLPVGELGTRRLTRGHQLFEESVDSLRTTLALSEQLKDVQVIAVVSAVSREGKTSLSAQLAISLARATGEPILLIDADLRAPDLHEFFAVPKEPGLAEVLAQGCTVREAIQHPAADSLVYLLPAGKLQKSPHILLSQGNLKSVIDQVRSEYHYVVIDTPPILSASESLAVAKSADGVLICTLSETSRTGQLRRTYERLFNVGARVIGVVLSGVPAKSYSYRYGSYGYQPLQS
jgi:polysaccharide biosynthesis transport protein